MLLDIMLLNITIANLHWCLATFLLIVAMTGPLSQSGGLLGAGVAIVLAGYGIVTGRDRQNPQQVEVWIYGGVATTLQAILLLIFYAFPNARLLREMLLPYGAAIASICGIPLYLLPWQTWGWSKRPWRRSAAIMPIPVAIQFISY
jgi:hypothetical protein